MLLPFFCHDLKAEMAKVWNAAAVSGLQGPAGSKSNYVLMYSILKGLPLDFFILAVRLSVLTAANEIFESICFSSFKIIPRTKGFSRLALDSTLICYRNNTHIALQGFCLPSVRTTPKILSFSRITFHFTLIFWSVSTQSIRSDAVGLAMMVRLHGYDLHIA